MAARLAAAALTALALAACAPSAAAAPVPAGVQAGTVTEAAAPATAVGARKAACNVGIPVIGGVVSTVTNAVCDAGSTVAGAAGSVVGAVGNTVLDGIASWVIDADTTVTTFVEKAMTNTTSPRLEASWYVAQFAPMAQLGGGIALLVALIAFTSAALRRSPEAIAATLAGIVRAGVGTGVAIPLTTLGLAISDQISAAVSARSPHAFFATVAHAWGASGFGGLGSSALATLIAFVELIGAVAVWLELIVRGAVIYVAVLFFPVALAASIWPKLGDWTGRLSKLLLQFVILKPVALIVLSLAGSAAAAGLSGGAGGITGSVGAILAAVVIFALAAAAPWALMYLLAADAESAWTSSAVRVGASQGLAKAGGGLRTLRPSTSGPGGGAAAAAGLPEVAAPRDRAALASREADPAGRAGAQRVPAGAQRVERAGRQAGPRPVARSVAERSPPRPACRELPVARAPPYPGLARESLTVRAAATMTQLRTVNAGVAARADLGRGARAPVQAAPRRLAAAVADPIAAGVRVHRVARQRPVLWAQPEATPRGRLSRQVRHASCVRCRCGRVPEAARPVRGCRVRRSPGLGAGGERDDLQVRAAPGRGVPARSAVAAAVRVRARCVRGARRAAPRRPGRPRPRGPDPPRGRECRPRYGAWADA